MKRALAIAVAVCTLGVAGFSQIAIKGSWTAEYCVLPIQTPTLTSTLVLTYTVAGFDITSTTGFGTGGLTAQSFALKGMFGPFSLSGKMRFDPAAVIYEVGQLVTSFDFGGVLIGLTVNHWVDGEWDAAYFGTTGGDPCDPAIVGGNLQYIFTAGIPPVSVRARFLDCCAGTGFQDLLVTLTGVDLCCGIKYNAELNFTKAGFSELVLSGINIPLCCGVSLGFSVTYGVSSKSVSITPSFAGLGEACFTVWGGPRMEGLTWEGIRIDAFRIRCTIAGCNYLEYVHAWAPTAATIPSTIRTKFACGANEYLELGFCGPGCCGGTYSATLRILWATGTTNSLFGLRGFVGSVSIPIMTNFTLSLTFRMPAVAGACTPSFCLGWTFTF